MKDRIIDKATELLGTKMTINVEELPKEERELLAEFVQRCADCKYWTEAIDMKEGICSVCETAQNLAKGVA